MTLLQELPREWRFLLQKGGFKQTNTKSQYESLRFEGAGSVIIFKSGKVLLQGNSQEVSELKFLLLGQEKKINIELTEVLIGTDESLKGDTFGGIVVAGVRADAKTRLTLIRLGVRDSKKLDKETIDEIAVQIMKGFPWAAANLLPEEYNHGVDGLGVTGLLNQLHKECFDKLKVEGSKHVVDQFPGCAVGDIAVQRGEDEFVEIAAASIIARHLATKQIENLSEKAGMRLPLGSTHVAKALEQMKKSGLPLNKFVKLGFRNVTTKNL